MTIKARKAGTNNKGTAARAKAHDLRLLEQADHETAEGGATAADTMRAAKVKLAKALAGPITTSSLDAEISAERAMADLQVPMTLGEICHAIGQDVAPDQFASSALRAIADQIKTTAVLVETDWSNDSWRLFMNLSERAELAGRVAGWLETNVVPESSQIRADKSEP